MIPLVKGFDKAKNIKELFDVVQESVKLTLNETRAGLDLGIIDLGNAHNALLSAYYPVGSNIIVLNKTPLRRMLQTQPQLMKPYVFVVLLHEYLHSLGYLDEGNARQLTYDITKEIFGNSTVTDMALDMRKFFPFLLYPGGHPSNNVMEVVELEESYYIG